MTERVHLIGIGGAGISAIARVLLERGVPVSGSDREESEYSRALQAAGVDVRYGHDASSVEGAEIVVASSAIPEENVEIQAARAAGIVVFRRPAFLPQLMREQRTLAIAGTHGKTTTSGMVAWILTEAGRDPGFIVGGMLPNFGTNAHAGTGPDFVIEADEYMRTFLSLDPAIALITNVEHDHPDCYPTYEDCLQTFEDFAARVRDTLIVCADNAGAAGLKASGVRRVTYGIAEQADWTLQNLRMDENGFEGDVWSRGAAQAVLRSGLGGAHNALNALGALTLAVEAGVDAQTACAALARYRGPARRFEVLGDAQGVTVIDDYAHHPTEIKATLAAAKGRYPQADIWAVFQPHTYSRTRTLLAELRDAFGDAAHVLVTNIFPAREAPDGETTGALVAQSLNHPDVQHTPDIGDAVQMLQQRVRPGDVVITLSAGDANRVGRELLAWLKKQKGDDSHG